MSDVAGGNAFLPGFIAAFNARFARAPARELDLHRPLEAPARLDAVLRWKVERHVSRQLTVHYNRMKLMIPVTEATRPLAGQRVEVREHRDGRIELVSRGTAVPYVPFDKLRRVAAGEIVENKRLGAVLDWVRERQAERPVPTGAEVGPARTHQPCGLMKDCATALRALAEADAPPKRPRSRPLLAPIPGRRAAWRDNPNFLDVDGAPREPARAAVAALREGSAPTARPSVPHDADVPTLQ